MSQTFVCLLLSVVCVSLCLSVCVSVVCLSVCVSQCVCVFPVTFVWLIHSSIPSHLGYA